MDSNPSLIFQLSLIFLIILQTEGFTNDEFSLLSPKPRNYQRDYPCMVGAGTKNTTCCTCPGSCGQTYPRDVARTYSKGIRVLRLYFSIRDQNRTKTTDSTDIRLYICPRDSTSDVIVQDCLLKNPLRIIHKSRTYKSLRLDVDIPPNLTCHHCLLQWSVTRGVHSNIVSPSRQYFGCSDIAILSLNDIESRSRDMLELGSGTGDSQTSLSPTSIASTQPAFQTSYGTTTPHSTTASPCWAVGEYANVPGLKEWCNTNCMRGYCPATHCKCSSESTTSHGPSSPKGTTNTPTTKRSPEISTTLPTTAPICRAVGLYANTPGMNEWCTNNCKRGYCPATHCKCSSESTTSHGPSSPKGTTNTPTTKRSPEISTTLPTTAPICRAVGLYANTPGMNEWCTNNCKRGYCPATHCKCSSESTTSHGPSSPKGTTNTPTTKRSLEISTTLPTTAPICRAVGLYANTPGMNEWCTNNCKRGYCPSTHCKCSSESTTSHGPSSPKGTTNTPTTKRSPEISTTLPTTAPICRAVGLYANTPGMNEWCTNNCKRGYCPATHCKCGSESTTSHGPSTPGGTTNTPTYKTSPEITTTLPATVPICRAIGLYANAQGMNEWCIDNCKRGNCPATHCQCTSVPITTVPVTHKLMCQGSGAYAGVGGMDQWCKNNCVRGYCPASHCKCILGIHKVTESTPILLRSRPITQMRPICRAVGIMATVKGMHKWCMMNCVNGYCPASHCKCSSGMHTTGSDQTSYTTNVLPSKQVNPTTTPKTWSAKPLINTTTQHTTRPQPSDIFTKLPNTDTANPLDIGTKQIPTSTIRSKRVTPSSTSLGTFPTTFGQRRKTHGIPLALNNSPPTASNATLLPTTSSTTGTSTIVPAASTVASTTDRTSMITSKIAKTGLVDQASTNAGPLVPASTGASSTAQVTTMTHKICTATGSFAGIDSMNNWCNTNCNNGYCPESQCKCDILTSTAATTCRAKQPYARSPGMHKWCITNCARGYCPSSHCQC